MTSIPIYHHSRRTIGLCTARMWRTMRVGNLLRMISGATIGAGCAVQSTCSAEERQAPTTPIVFVDLFLASLALSGPTERGAQV
jgi:hypothetical protein